MCLAAVALVFGLALQGAAAIRPGAVSGTIQMPDGSAAPAVRVAAMLAPPPSIRPTEGQNYFTSQPPVSVALTGADGRYQFSSLPPGRYFIVAGVTGQATYYPATTNIDDATAVVVESGSTVTNLDFRLATSPGSRVRGRVTSPPAAGVAEKAVLSGVNLGELLEAPVRPDGTFEFGRIPRGNYLLSLYPAFPGLASLRFSVADQDVAGLDFVRPAVQTVSGKIVVEKGPLPRSFLAFSTPQDFVSGTITPDGTFTAKLHAARHRVELGGLPVGYSIESVRIGSADVLRDGFVVGKSDVTGIVITVKTPSQLPALKGRLTAAPGSLSSARVEITGPVIGTLDAPVAADGSFEFPALPKGLYRVRVPQLAQVPPMNVVVDASGADVQLSAAAR
jgi:hypothetical protein